MAFSSDAAAIAAASSRASRALAGPIPTPAPMDGKPSRPRPPELAQRAGWPRIGELSPDAWSALGLLELPADPRVVDGAVPQARCPRCRQPALGSELVDLRGLTPAARVALGLALPAICTHCLRFLNTSAGLPLAVVAKALGLPATQQAALAYHDAEQVRIGVARPLTPIAL